MPTWVTQGVEEYTRRMPRTCQIKFTEIPLGQRAKNRNIKQAMQQEAGLILAAIPDTARVVALDVNGQNWSTTTLATKMQDWMQSGQDVALLVGGPDGMTEACLKRATEHWSLSGLTLPHPLVRIILAEQLYRANMILQNHPYHK